MSPPTLHRGPRPGRRGSAVGRPFREETSVTKKDLFLEEARLGPRNAVLVRYDESPHLLQIQRRAPWYAWVDLAHVVMLVETGILDRVRGGRLLDGLLEVQKLGADAFPWNLSSGSYLVQVGALSRASALGEDIAGRLQTGRSRNDQEAAAERLLLARPSARRVRRPARTSWRAAAAGRGACRHADAGLHALPARAALDLRPLPDAPRVASSSAISQRLEGAYRADEPDARWAAPPMRARRGRSTGGAWPSCSVTTGSS